MMCLLVLLLCFANGRDRRPTGAKKIEDYQVGEPGRRITGAAAST